MIEFMLNNIIKHKVGGEDDRVYAEYHQTEGGSGG